MKNNRLALTLSLCFLCAGCQIDGKEEVTRFVDEAVATTYESTRSKTVELGKLAGLAGSLDLGMASSLVREMVVFNHSSAPIQVMKADLEINLKDITRYSIEYHYSGSVKLRSLKDISAVEYSISLFDVFGRHMVNLGGFEVRDIATGEEITFEGTWRASEEAPSELLTSVVFVRRVRYEDGTQWQANLADLALGLGELKLEKLEEVELEK